MAVDAPVLAARAGERRARSSDRGTPSRRSARRRMPAPFGQSTSRPTCSSIRLSSALKSGLFTACAITERRHSAACRGVARRAVSAAVCVSPRDFTGGTRATLGFAGSGDSTRSVSAAAATARPAATGQRLDHNGDPPVRCELRARAAAAGAGARSMRSHPDVGSAGRSCEVGGFWYPSPDDLPVRSPTAVDARCGRRARAAAFAGRGPGAPAGAWERGKRASSSTMMSAPPGRRAGIRIEQAQRDALQAGWKGCAHRVLERRGLPPGWAVGERVGPGEQAVEDQPEDVSIRSAIPGSTVRLLRRSPRVRHVGSGRRRTDE